MLRNLHFLWAGLVKQGQTGGIVPSQRFLVEKMIAPIPADYQGQVIELGPGTGALTVRLAEKCRQIRIVACEINPLLARVTQRTISEAGHAARVQVINDAAENYLAGTGKNGNPAPEFIISGIPLGHLAREKALALIAAIRSALRPGGMYIQFQHSFLDRKKVQNSFSSFHTVPVLLNFPPAFVYYARK